MVCNCALPEAPANQRGSGAPGRRSGGRASIKIRLNYRPYAESMAGIMAGAAKDREKES